MSTANLALVAASLVLGWIALFPSRHSLGPLGYHLSAIPVGLAIWPLVGAMTTVARASFGLRNLVLAGGGLALMIAAILFVLERTHPAALREGGRVTILSYVVAAVAVMGPAFAVNALGMTEGNYDSVFHYYAWGVWLRDTGSFTNAAAGASGFGLPAISAVTMALGGDWTFVIYPILGLIVAVLTAWTLYDYLPRSLSLPMRATITGVSVAVMGTTPMYLYSLYHVHSQMISAMYLVLGVVGVIRAFGVGRPAEETLSGDESAFTPNVAWLVVAGISCAGLCFARVDGLAYQAVILLVATGAAFASGTRGKGLVPLFVSALAFELAAYGMVVWRIKLWKSSTKLSGRVAFAVLAAIALYALVVVVAARIKPLAEWLHKPRSFFWLAGLGGVAAIAVLWIREPKGFATAVGNQLTNMTQTGSWGYLWFFLAGVVLLSILFAKARGRDDVASYVLFAVFEFAVIALVVHGTSHSGRISPYDTFNRVVFHVVPLLFVYVGLITGGLVSMLRNEASA